MTDLIKLYNPANASALTQTEIEGLQKLTSDEIKQLAKAYPNAIYNRAYLLIVDSKSKVEKQLPTLSTFENLYNLREKNAMRQYVAYGFRGEAKPKPPAKINVRRSEVRDLSDVELMTLPGFKVKDENGQPKEIPMPEKVEVTKVKKQKTKKS